MRPRKSLDDYYSLGESKGVVPLIDALPKNTNTSIEWQCRRCTRIVSKSYANVVRSEFPCICHSPFALDEDDYEKVAELLKLDWRGEHLPINSKQKTRWYSYRTRMEFDAAYSELAYQRIKKSLHRYIQVQPDLIGYVPRSVSA